MVLEVQVDPLSVSGVADESDHVTGLHLTRLAKAREMSTKPVVTVVGYEVERPASKSVPPMGYNAIHRGQHGVATQSHQVDTLVESVARPPLTP